MFTLYDKWSARHLKRLGVVEILTSNPAEALHFETRDQAEAITEELVHLRYLKPRRLRMRILPPSRPRS